MLLYLIENKTKHKMKLCFNDNADDHNDDHDHCHGPRLKGRYF